jgi:hypothetical protein
MSFTILPRLGSFGDNATSTRSPGRNLTKFTFVALAAWARTKLSLSNFTRTVSLGSNSTTIASTAFPTTYGLVNTHGPLSVIATQCSKWAE